MRKCYIVFDQLPSVHDGGLVATYINLLPYLKKNYDVNIVSVFDCKQEVKDESAFNGCSYHCMNSVVIDNRFFRFFQYLKEKRFSDFLYAIYSAFVYFFSVFSIRLKIRALLKQEDLVIVSSPAAGMFMSKKIPFILDIHTSFEYFFGRLFIGKLQSILMRKPKLTVFRNELDAKKGSKLFLSDYIYNFVPDEIAMHKEKSDFKNRIIFVGRLHEHKNPLRLIECANELRKDGVHFTLDIYGTGPLENAMKGMIQSLNLEEYVQLKGFLVDKRVYREYDLLWLTSNLEGFPLVIVEAKANRVPTVSIKWGDAIHEVIHHEKDGFVCESNEDMVKFTKMLLENKIEFNAFSNAAYEDYMKRFSQACYFEKFEQNIAFFDELIKNKN